MIHYSHSRKELIELIHVFEFDIEGYEELNRNNLGITLWSYLEQQKDISENTELFKDIEELKMFLRNKSPSRVIPSKNKLEVFDKIRELIYYCKGCNYIVFTSNFKTLKDIIKCAEEIKIYGDEPSVRRVLRLLNKDVKIKDIIEPEISKYVQNRLQRKQDIIKKTKPSFKKHKGQFTVIFN